MEKEDKKVFVAGYYDDRIFEGEFFDGMCLYDDKVNCYTLEEVLKLPFVEGVEQWFEENDEEEREFYRISDKEKIKAILDYTEYDEIAGVEYYETEEEAKNKLNYLLEKIHNIEEKIKTGKIVYKGQKQDEYGNFKEVYSLKED
ncbi:MAG: hypothetical protein ACLR02_09755 [Clostridium sp.]